MNIEEQLSKIEHIYQNYKNMLGEEQFVQFTYQLKGYKEKQLKNQPMIETQLQDVQFFHCALMHGAAALELKKLYDEQFQNINQMIIRLLKWRLIFYEKKKQYIVIISEFKSIGISDQSYDCSEFDLERDLQQKQQKLKLSIQRNSSKAKPQSNEIQQMSTKKVKIESSVFSKSVQDSFRLNESLLNTFLQETSLQQPPQSATKTNLEFVKISTMYQGMGKWVLEGRVILKTDVMQFKNKKNDQIQPYFKIIIIDCEQEIITGLFYDKAVNKFFDFIQQHQVYTFKNGAISQDKQDGSKKITFNEFSMIKDSENFAIPESPQLHLLTIQDTIKLEQNSVIDIIAVVQEIKFTDDTRKNIMILDQTGRINLTFWGQQYQNLEIVKGEVIVIKGLRVNAHSSLKSLNSAYQTVIIKNQELFEVKQLKAWLVGKDLDSIMKPITDVHAMNLQQIEEYVQILLTEGKTTSVQPKFVYCYIMEIKEYNIMYPSCPANRCLAKMEEVPYRKTFRCKKCHTENDSPKYRFILKVILMDDTTNIKATIFDENTVKLLGLTADQLRLMSDQEQRDKLIISSFRQKKIKLGIQFKEFNGTIQPQYSVQEIEDIDYKELARSSLEIYEELEYLVNISLMI